MEMWLIFAAIAVFIGGSAVYLVFMIFFPEWVGITGETALKAEQSHRGDVPHEEGPDPLKGVSKSAFGRASGPPESSNK